MEISKTLLSKYRAIEDSQRIYLDSSLPLVIRLDGRGVTKNRDVYHLIPYAEWREPIMCAATETAEFFAEQRGAVCEVVLLGGMDEVNIAYRSGEDFLGLFDNTNAVYAAGIFLQEFTRRLRGLKNRETDFGISIFTIQPDQIDEYLDLRALMIHKSALDYIIKVNNLGWCSEPAVMRGIYEIAEKRAEREDKKEPGFLNGIRKSITLGSR